MLEDRVKCTVPAPGTIGVGSTVSLGATPSGYRSFLTAFGATNAAYFVLSDGISKTITGIWTVNAGGTATITEIIWNDATGSAVGDTFSSTCTAWNALPAREMILRRDTPFAGLRNIVINGSFLVNQRGYVSGAATAAANTFTLDRWKVLVSGQNISWTDSGGVRTVTFPAGGGEQVIEGLGLIGGTYVANWVGSATMLLGGAAITKGVPFTVTGGANLTLRMSAGTCSRLQIEPGKVPTPFEQRHIQVETALCQRYFCVVRSHLFGYSAVAANARWMSSVFFPVKMRTTPTMTFANSVLTTGVNVRAAAYITDSGCAIDLTTATGPLNFGDVGDWYADAEI